MAYELPIGQFTFAASTGLQQYTFVELNSAGVLAQPSTAGMCIGVLVSSGTTGSTGAAGSTTSGRPQAVQFYGIAKLLSGSSSIVIGDLITNTTNGLAKVATSTDYVYGIALAAGVSTSTVAEVIPVLLKTFGSISTAS